MRVRFEFVRNEKGNFVCPDSSQITRLEYTCDLSLTNTNYSIATNWDPVYDTGARTMLLAWPICQWATIESAASLPLTAPARPLFRHSCLCLNHRYVLMCNNSVKKNFVFQRHTRRWENFLRGFAYVSYRHAVQSHTATPYGERKVQAGEKSRLRRIKGRESTALCYVLMSC